MNDSFNYLGASCFWRRLRLTSVTSGDLVVIPADSAGGAAPWRIIVTGYHVVAQNINAAVATWTLRNKTTATEVLLGGTVGITNSVQNSDCSNTWLPMTSGVTLELNVAGAITGSVDVTVWGRFLPASTPVADKYTGAP